MENTKQTLDAFFEQYAARINRALGISPVVDVDASTAAFAESFVEASPKGIVGGKNDEEFRQAISQGLGFYRSIGTKSMTIKRKTINRLDDYHWMVKVHWLACYRKQDSSETFIEFDVIYLLQMLDECPKIFAYITGDEEKVHQEHGLVPC
jgi:hypothetical protein